MARVMAGEERVGMMRIDDCYAAAYYTAEYYMRVIVAIRHTREYGDCLRVERL